MLRHLYDLVKSFGRWVTSFLSKDAAKSKPQPSPKPVIFPNVEEHEFAAARIEGLGFANAIIPSSDEVNFVTVALKQIDTEIKQKYPTAETCTCVVTNATSQQDVLTARGIAKSACLGFQTAYSGRYQTREK